MSFIAFASNEASALRIYEKTDTVSIISEQPSYIVQWKSTSKAIVYNKCFIVCYI